MYKDFNRVFSVVYGRKFVVVLLSIFVLFVLSFFGKIMSSDFATAFATIITAYFALNSFIHYAKQQKEIAESYAKIGIVKVGKDYVSFGAEEDSENESVDSKEVKGCRGQVKCLKKK